MKKEFAIKWAVVLILSVILIVSIVVLSQPEVAVSGYELHTVQEGESMWTICSEYNPECEFVGELVKLLMQENEKADSVIYPGEAVMVPVGE